ncbi:MAG: 50S ribosomal protein L31 [Pseudomonadota bacterium]|nr:50S ribosomal protein L31 [Pseudomonadota bacterium]
MQNNIHPTQYAVSVICTCGNKFNIMSSDNKKVMHIEHCLKCHPAYTGKRKIAKAGRIESFNERFKDFAKSLDTTDKN